MTFHTPSWIRDEKGRIRFVLGLAAIYCCESGKIADLAKTLEISSGAIHMMMIRGRITFEAAVKLEELLGQENFPREMFLPPNATPR